MLKNVFVTQNLDLHDSVARDHLANERTFGAWIRTSLASFGVGYLITRIKISDPSSSEVDRILALIFISTAIVCVLVGTIRYIQVEMCMQKGYYPTGGIGITLIAILSIAAFVTSFVIILI